MASWRLKQLQLLNIEFIEQDRVLIDFVKKHDISTLVLRGTEDIKYFQSYLPNVLITSSIADYKNFALAILVTGPVCFEVFLSDTNKQIANFKPKYVYIAINKYLVGTQVPWSSLTDNYDKDLLDILTSEITSIGYKEIARSYIENDRGQYFNFAHPTTNVYYEIL
jgi:hypothetical protein